MRVSMFAQAAAGLGDTLVLVVGDQQGEIAGHDMGGARIVGVPAQNRPDTRLVVIRDHLSQADRPEQLRLYGRPTTSILLSAPVIEELVQHIEGHSPDVVVLSRSGFLPLVQVLRARLACRQIIVDLDDDDARLQRSYAHHEQLAGNQHQATWYLAEADVIDQLIRSTSKDVTCYTCASAATMKGVADRLLLDGLETIENGVTLRPRLPPRGERQPELLFVGNLSYRPNIDGLRWFHKEVWPQLKAARPELRLCVVGSMPGREVREICSNEDVRLASNPADLDVFYRRASAGIVPLRFGSGSRIKILEAGSYNVPVISTKVGAEGLGLADGEHAYITSATPSDLATACLECLGDRAEAERRAKNLYDLVGAKHSRVKKIAEIQSLLASLTA